MKSMVKKRTKGRGPAPNRDPRPIAPYIAAAGQIPVRAMLIVDSARGRGLYHCNTGPADAAK
jgi:hypothetical protein